MKDLEKIKSEDLGCQVQDANPGNFAIEQEVAALVGATVPAPTAPSADDARELGAQLLVFLRRALTPIKTALRTAVAAIYAHLDSRCTDYTPAAYASYLPLPSYDPMRPLTPRTLPNLLTALTAFSARKISNGSAPNDGIPDGTSLARLIGGDYSDVTKVVDDTPGWTAPIDAGTRIKTAFPNCKDFTLGCRVALGRLFSANDMTALTLTDLQVQNDGYLLDGNFTGLTEVTIPVVQIKSTSNWTQALLRNNSTTKVLRCPNLKYMTNTIGAAGLDSSKILVYDCSGIEEIYAENLEEFCSNPYGAGGIASGAPNLKKVVVGNIKIWHCQYYGPYFFDNYRGKTYDNLIDLEFKSLSCSLNLKNWTAANVLSGDNLTTFLQNFKEHIALRLTANGSGLTLTLSQAVFDTIWNQDGTPKSTDPDSVIYQINKIIKTDKHWSVNRA